MRFVVLCVSNCVVNNGLLLYLRRWMSAYHYENIIRCQTCSLDKDRGHGYRYGYEVMGTGSSTGLRPWVVRVRV